MRKINLSSIVIVKKIKLMIIKLFVIAEIMVILLQTVTCQKDEKKPYEKRMCRDDKRSFMKNKDHKVLVVDDREKKVKLSWYLILFQIIYT